MKKSTLIFAVCLAVLGLHNAMADDADAARAARRPGAPAPTTGATATTSNSSRQKVSKPATTTTAPASTSRGAAITSTTTKKPNQTVSSRTATTTPGPRDGNVISESARHTVGTRTTGAARTATTQSRAAITPSRNAASTARSAATPSRGAITSARGTTAARAADASALRDAILNRDYSTCKTVYFDCMDEFCANKDSQLKRCACSARIHEFDSVKKQLAKAEEKMLDFSERLLTVNMDKEDAAALFVATEGENAFNNTKDTSDSKKILDEIAKKLKTGSSDDSFNQSLESISLSLNMDAAFDSVDSLLGASTTTKEGTALYNAALPVCREMAAEVCDEDSLSLAISGYQMAIEQDCTTVSKTYSTQADQAREKVLESSALLDMSRLDIYQKRNSDDILTCKKKMLTQLNNTSVCGDSLGKCLDISGRYIDPSTGQAFLTENLADLATLISRPTGDESWTSAPNNMTFVKYLQSKKKYIEPATENCQAIADGVWDVFLEDALAQIKLAQEAKLEEVRQSCTTLTTQCLSTTAKSLEDFDARALSTFGVAADKTVNAMCENVKNSCTALMNATDDTNNNWVGGMTQIATEKTYDTILQTCREVGRACIIQVCKSVSGNFGLCENMDTSINRKSIINRTACWNEVLQCVQSAGADSINNIFEKETKANFDSNGSFYTELYGKTTSNGPDGLVRTNNEKEKGCTSKDKEGADYDCIFDICIDDCNNKGANSFECRTCRIAEKIWGNCEAWPPANITALGAHNRILIPKSNASTTVANQPSTLLSWFATNTGTAEQKDSCRDTTCGAGFIPKGQNKCVNTSSMTPGDGSEHGISCSNTNQRIKVGDGNTQNCCGSDDKYQTILNNNCCEVGTINPGNVPYFFDANKNGTIPTQLGTKCSILDSSASTYQPLARIDANTILVCQGTISISDNIWTCSGRYVYITNDNKYIDPINDSTKKKNHMYYWDSNGTKQEYSNGAKSNAWLITSSTADTKQE